MTDNYYFTTGQVSGVCKTPQVTIRRYIKDYKSSFSEQATRPTKGRRYTEADIKTILLIRHLYFERFRKPKIQQVLSGELVIPGLENYQVHDVIQLLQSTLSQVDRANKIYKWVKSAKETIESNEASLNKYFEENNRVIGKLTEKIGELEFKITALESGASDTKRWWQKRS